MIAYMFWMFLVGVVCSFASIALGSEPNGFFAGCAVFCGAGLVFALPGFIKSFKRQPDFWAKPTSAQQSHPPAP